GEVQDVSMVMSDPRGIIGRGLIRTSGIHAKIRIPGGNRDFPNELQDWEKFGDDHRDGLFKGVIWSNRYERTRVVNLVNSAWRKSVQKAYDQFMVDLTLGLYEWALSEMSVGYGRFRIGVVDVFALTGDVDHYGRKLPKGKKIEIIANVLLSNLTDYAGEELREKMIDEVGGYQAPGDRAITVKDVAHALRGRNMQQHKVDLDVPTANRQDLDLPASLNEDQKQRVAPFRAEGNELANLDGSLSCPPPRSDSVSEADASSWDSTGKALTVAARYGGDALIVRNDPAGARQQEFGTCQAEAVMNAAGVDMNPIAVLRLMAENSKTFAHRLKNATAENHPLRYGFTESEMRILAGALGRESKHMMGGKQTSMRILQGLKENGWSIKIAIHAEDFTGPGDNKHAVDIVDIKSSGCDLSVTIYDKSLQATITMPAKEFQDRLANWPIMLHRKKEGAEVPDILRKSDYDVQPPKARITADEFDPRPIVVEQFDELPLRQYSIDEAINQSYPDISGAPPLNVVRPEYHQRLLNGAVWEQPARGGAAFSRKGMGTVYGGDEGDVVIRINKDFAAEHIVWVADEQARGVNPLYYPEGLEADGSGIGQHKTYVPREHLEFLDVSQPGEPAWRTYTGEAEQ
ncbi:MAG: hypothetical protein AAGC96_15340, partial [Pseudomonadota bacterium]